jgi:hypothetical protein
LRVGAEAIGACLRDHDEVDPLDEVKRQHPRARRRPMCMTGTAARQAAARLSSARLRVSV